MPMITVANEADLNAAITAIDTGPSNTPYTITLSQSFSLTSALVALNIPSNSTVFIDGAHHTIDGGVTQLVNGVPTVVPTYNGFFVYSGNVTIQDLTVANTVSEGGSGSGGGAGFGGGLFVAAAANVTLSNVSFTGDQAIGGTGIGGSGGGGGMLGGSTSADLNNGASGGGGIGPSATGGNSSGAAAGAGIVLGAASGGSETGRPGGLNGGAGAAGGYVSGGLRRRRHGWIWRRRWRRIAYSGVVHRR
jgi:hypothetical protein